MTNHFKDRLLDILKESQETREVLWVYSTTTATALNAYIGCHNLIFFNGMADYKPLKKLHTKFTHRE